MRTSHLPSSGIKTHEESRIRNQAHEPRPGNREGGPRRSGVARLRRTTPLRIQQATGRHFHHRHLRTSRAHERCEHGRLPAGSRDSHRAQGRQDLGCCLQSHRRELQGRLAEPHRHARTDRGRRRSGSGPPARTDPCRRCDRQFTSWQKSADSSQVPPLAVRSAIERSLRLDGASREAPTRSLVARTGIGDNLIEEDGVEWGAHFSDNWTCALHATLLHKDN